MTNDNLSFFQPVGTLFLTVPDTEFSRFCLEADQLAREFPEILERIKQDLDKEALRKKDITEIEMEIGDLLFSVVNLCRFLNVQPEEALRKSTRKFVDRFQRVEATLERNDKTFGDYDLSKLDQIWEQVKLQEKT